MKILNSEITPRLAVTLNRSMQSKKTEGIMTFGLKNDYPQAVEKLILGSETAKASAGILARYIAGAGFANPDIGKIVVGKDHKGKPIDLDSIRRAGAKSLAYFNGVYIHCNENLNKKVGNTRVVPFKNCRFTKEDVNGYCGKIGVHPNWAKEKGLQSFKKEDIAWFYNFNIDAIDENVRDAGGPDKFSGQMYFLFVDNDYLYPLSPFDSVHLDMDTEYQIQLYKNRQIRDGFTDKIVMLVEPPDDKEQREEMLEKIESMMGPNGGNLVILEAEFDKESGDLVANSTFKTEKIETTINDKLFENWERGLANSIRKAANALPAVLIDYEQGQLSQASGEMLAQAEKYYNALTLSIRQEFSQLFADIYRHFDSQVLQQNTDWTIQPLTLFENGTIIDPNTTGKYKADGK